MKNVIISFLLISTLSSCYGYKSYDIKGIGPGLMPATQETYLNKIDNYKTGEACVTNLLGLIAFGDSSIQAAAKNGEIKEIATIYTRYRRLDLFFPIFQIFQRGCTVVNGA